MIDLKRLVLLLGRLLEAEAGGESPAASPQELKVRTEAFTSCRIAAEHGNADGQYLLAFLYSLGLGTPQDLTAAAHWYRRAAAQGHAEAQYVLGLMYYHGRGVAQDTVQAYLWLTLAALRVAGGAEAASAVHARDFLARQMTGAQLVTAHQLVRQWQLTLADTILL